MDDDGGLSRCTTSITILDSRPDLPLAIDQNSSNESHTTIGMYVWPSTAILQFAFLLHVLFLKKSEILLLYVRLKLTFIALKGKM